MVKKITIYCCAQCHLHEARGDIIERYAVCTHPLTKNRLIGRIETINEGVPNWCELEDDRDVIL